MEETVTTMQTIEENGMDQKLWPSDLNEQYSALSSRMENIIAAAGDFVEDSAVWNTYAAAVTEKKALVQEAETALSTAEQALTDATAAYESACVINVPVNEDVANIENAKPGETVDLNTTEITNEVLTSAKEHQVLLEITGNGYVWRIDATTVEGEVTEPVNLSVDRHTKSIPTDLIQKTAGENSYYEFAIVHDGDFGFDAVLSFFTDIKHSGKTAELYHYENEALKKVSEITVDKEGYATFTQDHASSYVIVIKEPKKDALPDTGAGKLPVGMVFVCGISGALALVLMKKRKEA